MVLAALLLVVCGCAMVDAYASGIVSQDCLDCICQWESGGCKPLDCRMDVGSLSCGYFQIKEAYWIDCGELGSGWEECSKDLDCASQCVQNYMDRYIDHYGCPLTCESFARSHNGGPTGCKKDNTVGYWSNVQGVQGCSGVQ